MVSTTDDIPPPILTAEDNSCEQEDEIKKMKDAISTEVTNSDDDVEMVTCDEEKENGDKPEDGVASTSTSPAEENNESSSNQNGTTNGDCNAPVANGDDSLGGESEVPQVNGGGEPLPLDDESKKPEANGAAEEPKSNVECIDLDDDEVEEPPSKKAKTDGDDADAKKSVKPEPELNSPGALLNKLEEYVVDAIDSKKNTERKVLDALLGAINVQVQKEPLSVRKLILDKQLVLPNTISFPPSREVDMLIEHDPDSPLSKVINRMFGEERPKPSEAEKKERQHLKQHNPAPHMTKLLMDIGQDLVQEATYCDIVHARNLPETPKNLETYKTVAAQLKPVWEALKKKNEPYKLKLLTCQVCGFKTESRMVLQNHRSRTHYRGGKYQCAMCPEYDTNEQRLLNHYLESHLVIATKDDPQAKYPCLICEEDYQFKGLRDQHMRVCKKDYSKVRHIMAPRGQDDILTINRWLWDRPPVDPTILQQQQVAQAQQQKKTQMQAAAAAAQAQAAAVLRRGTAGLQGAQAAILQQQLLQQQQRQQQMRQLGAMMASTNAAGRMINGVPQNSLIAAMQQHLRAAASQNGQRNQSPANFYQKTMNSATTKSTALLQAQRQAQAQAALKNAATLTPQAVQKALSAMSGTSSPASASSSSTGTSCEICDQAVADKEKYLSHLQMFHKQMRGKAVADMQQGAPLACSRCRDRFWTYEGLERHLVMAHGLVTADLLSKAQKKEDGGRCKLCGKQYAFNMLQHLVADHQVKLCSAEIMYSCDVCSFKCSSYVSLEDHLSKVHPKNSDKAAASDSATSEKTREDCITLDD